MNRDNNISFIKTNSDRCRVCYTCVRECPAKAIRITSGQAEVIPERCISCGNCVRVCSQNAKQVVSSIERVEALLREQGDVAACIAPSFPAEFADMQPEELVGMIRSLGFKYVTDVGYGADLVAQHYKKLLTETNNDERYIATSCPAIIGYVEKYHPDIAGHLAPVVSPMIAMARVLHKMHGKDLKIVFIGPCIAKKCEADSVNVSGEVDAVLTFAELRQLLLEKQLSPGGIESSKFDPPSAGLGGLFPLSRGMLQSAGIEEDLLSTAVVTTDGKSHFPNAITEFENGTLDARLLEVLACHGCIMGAGMNTESSVFDRRGRVSRYVRESMAARDDQEVKVELADQEFYRDFSIDDQRIVIPFGDELNIIMERMGKHTPEDELNCGACGYDTCCEHAEAIFKGLAENEMCLPNTIEQLHNTVTKLADSNEQLASARDALTQSEKMASMGQLAAGIAHEVNNPLGVVLMYAHLLLEQDEVDPQLKEDLTMITEQADRCKKIVSGLLHFARQNKVEQCATNIIDFIDRTLKVHNLAENVQIETDCESIIDPVIELDPDQMTQVLINLMNNAQGAMADGGKIKIAAKDSDEMVELIVSDTGSGISKENLPKLFEPFFTTKSVGEGTGLGLAVTFGIVKMHSGDIRVESNCDLAAGPTGTKFVITLPRKKQG